tara:strand:+ start:489 stop:692 length:204 start_codon:yes stop_codon:yes gene_type:complete
MFINIQKIIMNKYDFSNLQKIDLSFLKTILWKQNRKNEYQASSLRRCYVQQMATGFGTPDNQENKTT